MFGVKEKKIARGPGLTEGNSKKRKGGGVNLSRNINGTVCGRGNIARGKKRGDL